MVMFGLAAMIRVRKGPGSEIMVPLQTTAVFQIIFLQEQNGLMVHSNGGTQVNPTILIVLNIVVQLEIHQVYGMMCIVILI